MAIRQDLNTAIDHTEKIVEKNWSPNAGVFFFSFSLKFLKQKKKNRNSFESKKKREIN